MSQWIDQNLSGGSKSSGNGTNITQKGADLFRTLGLGLVPNAIANVGDVAHSLISGQKIDPNNYQNPLRTQAELNQQFPQLNNQGLNTAQKVTQGYPQVAKDTVGALSWMVPETKLLKTGESANVASKVLGGVVNRGGQGAVQGALNAVSQDQNPVSGAVGGAVTNPVISGAGRAVTDVLPRYIGLRNFGPAGLNLPEVTKAEMAAGGDSLKNTRDQILNNVKPFDLSAENDLKNPQNRFALMNKITDLANSKEWKGTMGLSDLVKKARRAFPSPEGKLPNINNLIQNSSDPFDAYSQIHNYAKSLGAYGPNQNTSLSNFLKSASHIAREHLISVSDNPAATRKAMDLYANQSAIGASSKTGNKIADILQQGALKGGGEAGIAALATLIPGLQGLAAPAFVDAALTNGLTGPPLARGLVKTGEMASNTGLADILRRLGISATQNVINPQNQENNTQL